MAYKTYDTVVIRDIRNETGYPDAMRIYSGHTAHVMKILTAQMYTPPNGNELTIYYELDIDGGKGLWPERFLKPYVEKKKTDDEYIEQILKLIAEIEGTCDAIKRELWRRKHK